MLLQHDTLEIVTHLKFDLRSEGDGIEIEVCSVHPHHDVVHLIIVCRIYQKLQFILAQIVGGVFSDELVHLVLHDFQRAAHHARIDEGSGVRGECFSQLDLLNSESVSESLIGEGVGAIDSLVFQCSGHVSVLVHLTEVSSFDLSVR